MTTPEIGQVATMSGEARSLVADEVTPVQFVDLLEERGLSTDAISFLAHAIPGDKAVEWACEAITQLQPEGVPLDGQDSLQATKSWLSGRTDQLRWKARASAENNGLSAPADCAAMAAFLCGDSIAPPDGPTVPPPPHSSNRLASSAVTLAVFANKPEEKNVRLAKALAIGRTTAEGAGLKGFKPKPAGPPASQQ